MCVCVCVCHVQIIYIYFHFSGPILKCWRSMPGLEARYGRWVCLCVAVLGMFMAGANNAFNVYQTAVKESFNLTATYGEYLSVSSDTFIHTNHVF